MGEWKLVTEEEKEMARAIFRILQALSIIGWEQAPKPWASLITYLELKRMKRVD